MEFGNILSLAMSSLIMLVVIHITVFYVVRTMYPPLRRTPQPQPQPQPQSVFTEAANTEKQNAVLPTYEAKVSADPPRQEGPAADGNVSTLATTTG
jgi:hypothetical protein